MIALFCMTIDHLAVVLVSPCVQVYLPAEGFAYSLGTLIITLMRCIGRIAFPIYCFCLYEGFRYTRSKWKYMLRLLLLAIISEIPFNLALAHTIWSFRYQNVFWTLCIGLLVISEIDGIERNIHNKYLTSIIQIVIVFSGMFLATYFHTDYGANGVLAIVIIWLVCKQKFVVAILCHLIQTAMYFVLIKDYSRDNIIMQLMMLFLFIFVMIVYIKKRMTRLNGPLACCLELTVNNPVEIFSFLMIPLMLLYNGEKGRINKWIFYLYYPAHLLLFSVIGILIGVYR